MKKHRLLVVDDSRVNTLYLSDLLSPEYEIKTALSGEKALELIISYRPDLILLDIVMTGIDGYETCRRIRQNPNCKHTKIMMLTAKSSLQERLKGYQVGADDYLVKPFDDNELLAKLRVMTRLKSVEEVDQIKTDILDLLTHETSTPLNHIIGLTELLANSPELPQNEKEEYAQLAYQSALSLHQLLTKVITLSAIKAGKKQFNIQPVCMNDLLESALASVRNKAIQRNINIQSQIEENIIVNVDPQDMLQVIAILLDNAIKFSYPDGTVRIFVKKIKDKVHLVVNDKGKGIKPERLPHVFDEFSIEDVAHHGEGQGLSLALAYHIMQNLRGEIKVQSDPEKGTNFYIVLPQCDLNGNTDTADENTAQTADTNIA